MYIYHLFSAKFEPLVMEHYSDEDDILDFIDYNDSSDSSHPSDSDTSFDYGDTTRGFIHSDTEDGCNLSNWQRNEAQGEHDLSDDDSDSLVSAVSSDNDTYSEVCVYFLTLVAAR